MPGAIATPPRIGVPFFEPSGHPDAVQASGGHPVPLRLPPARPEGGFVLAREWVADVTEISCAGADLDALLLATEDPDDLVGMLLAALRLDLPAVCVSPGHTPLSVALAALGVSPLAGDAAEVVVGVAREDGPRASAVVQDFSLANALRAGLSAGGGPDLLVHLSAIAREAGVLGFRRMIRVLTPETPALTGSDSAWLAKHDAAGLLSLFDVSGPAGGGNLHDTRTVAGPLRELLPVAPAAPLDGGARLVFVRGRASGTEAVCRGPEGEREVAGECRVFTSEDDAARAVLGGAVAPSSLIVVGGRGPRGVPGLSRLEGLGSALRESGLEGGAAVLTDGLPPDGVGGVWISLFTPEASSGGILSLLRDGDKLRIDLEEASIRTDADAKEISGREPLEYPRRPGAGYAARYARSALPALEGAGFG